MWHRRLGHVNTASIKKLRKMELISMIKTDDFSTFHICVEAKHAKKPFKCVISRKVELLELIHSDFKNTVSK